jgi:GWxTD domain-containing protein
MSGRAWRLLLLQLALLSGGASTARAQGAEAVGRLMDVRARLAMETDSLALRRREAQLIEVAKSHRDSTLLHLELGLVALRLGEVAGRRHYDDAASEFEWAAELAPSWPMPWWGLALAEEGLGDARVSPVAGIQAMLGKDKGSRAVAALRQALRLEPSFAPALVDLARITEAQRFNIRLEDAVTAFRLAGGGTSTDRADVQLARGRIERLAGSPDTALAAFRRYAALGGVPGVAQLEEARTLFVLDSLSGSAPYFAGATSEDTTAVRLYGDDLRPIASDSEMTALATARGRGRVNVLRQFWFTRDRADLRGDGERLREHYRRLHVARQRFRLAEPKRRYDTDERYRSGSREFDDRGIIFIRHGSPDDSVRYVAMGVCANETWRYRRPDGDVVLHFVARDDVQDFRLVESVLDIVDAGGITRLRQENCPGGNVSDLVLSRVGLSPLYDRLLNASRNNYVQLANEDRVQGQQAIRTGTTTDTYALRFRTPLYAVADGRVVGRDEGRPLLHVTFALEGESAWSRATEVGEAYPVRLRVMASGASGELLASVDTARIFIAERKLRPNEFLMGRIAVPVPPGVVRYRVAVSQGEERGVLLPTDSALAPPVAGLLALSDVALGAPGVGARWTTPAGEVVRMNPLGLYRVGGTLDLYAEVYGVAPGAPLAVTLHVTRQGKRGLFGLFGGKRSLTIRSEETAEGPGSVIRRSVSLAGLPAGDYRLSLRVQDATGRVVERRRGFRLVERPGVGSP